MLAQVPKGVSFPADAHQEIEYYSAVAYYAIGNLRDAIAITERALLQPSYAVTGASHARFLVLRSWLHASAREYPQQAILLSEALSGLLSHKTVDVGLTAGAAQSLSILARDMYLPEAIGLISRAAKAIEWPNDLSLQHVQVLRLLGWAKAMHGDYISAIRQIAGASRIADTALTSLLTSLDHAWVAAISQQHFLRDAALADAAEHLSADISSPLGDDAAALVLAAELFADHDLEVAQHALDRAKHTQLELPRNVGYAHDERLGAMIDFADACIRCARGETRSARIRAKRAFEVFQPIGYVWRAGNCAMLLYRITGKSSWLEAAETAASAYPRSFLAAELGRWQRRGRSPQERLTPRQRQIFEMLRRGATFAQIGAALGCSPNTVRIHTGRIYETFGVPKHAGLQGLIRMLSDSAA